MSEYYLTATQAKRIGAMHGLADKHSATLRHVHLHEHGGCIYAVATDGVVLAELELCPSDGSPCDIWLNKDCCVALKKAKRGALIEADRIVVDGNLSITTAQFGGKYPPYRQAMHEEDCDMRRFGMRLGLFASLAKVFDGLVSVHLHGPDRGITMEAPGLRLLAMPTTLPE